MVKETKLKPNKSPGGFRSPRLKRIVERISTKINPFFNVNKK